MDFLRRPIDDIDIVMADIGIGNLILGVVSLLWG